MAANDALSVDQLAENLQKCAALVKQNHKNDPLLRQTIHDLTFFITGKRVSPRPSNKGNVLSKTNSASNFTSTLGKMVGLPGSAPLSGGTDHPPASSSFLSTASSAAESEAAAASIKNAARVKADLEQHQHYHQPTQGVGVPIKPTSSRDENWSDVQHTRRGGPEFRRPTNPNSSLIANGWIEQQRRSKMRTVWKQVIMSLVEGKDGHSPALWIQREIFPENGPLVGGKPKKPELEALHQIPARWIIDVTYAKYSADNKFTITVKNMAEEFIFRCPGSQEAAQDWVATIRSIMGSSKDRSKASTSLDDWEDIPEDKKTAAASRTQHESAAASRTQQESAAASRTQQESAAASRTQQESAAASRTQHESAAVASRTQHEPDVTPSGQQSRKAPPQSQPQTPQQPPAPHHTPPQEQPRMSISELRAIAHGAGITTHGMERGELERFVQQLFTNQHRYVTPEMPTASSTSPAIAAEARNGVPWDEQRAGEKEREEVRKLKDEEAKAELERLRQHAERQKRQEIEEKRQRESEQNKVAEEERRREEEERRLLEAERMRREEEERRRLEAEQLRREEEERRRLEAERLRREEEEHRKRVAELQAAEQRRREEEQRRLQQQQWAKQQQEWQRQQEEEAQRRKVEEIRQAEERRRQEEAFRQHQQWQHQQPGHQPWQQQQQTPFGPHFAQPPPQQQHPGTSPAGSSPINMKYAKMATQATDGRRQHIKHNVLVEWALQPPTMQILRSIEFLITTIHTVFPPKYGVAPHEHFGKWSVVPMSEVLTGAQPDKEKLNKAVRKLRFFLHPDKLPREFTEEQHFVCKMLWDITSDAYEEFKKREEELGWMRGP